MFFYSTASSNYGYVPLDELVTDILLTCLSTLSTQKIICRSKTATLSTGAQTKKMLATGLQQVGLMKCSLYWVNIINFQVHWPERRINIQYEKINIHCYSSLMNNCSSKNITSPLSWTQMITTFILPTFTLFAAQLSLLSKNSIRSLRGAVVCNAVEMTTVWFLAKLQTTQFYWVSLKHIYLLLNRTWGTIKNKHSFLQTQTIMMGLPHI